MGLFDGFTADFSPAPNGWGDVAVTPGQADPNNMSLAEKLRLGLTGSTDKNPDIAAAGGALSKGLGGMFGAKPQQQQQQPAQPGPSNPHQGEGVNFAQQIASGQSPFTATSATPVGQKRPMTQPLYTSPFAAAPTGHS